VLGDPRRQLLELEADVGAGLVLRVDGHGDRPLDRDEHSLHRKAALVRDLELVGPLDDARINERTQVVLVVLKHEHAAQDSDLRPREPDAARVDHQRLHPLDEPAEIGVELLDGLRLHPQHGIGVLADLSEREPAPHLRLGVELDVANLALILGILAHAQGVYGPQHLNRMDRRERMTIMSEGAIRKDDPRDAEHARRLAEDIEGSPLKGRRIRQRLKNFVTGADNYVASIGGPLPWMQRRRMIEDETAQHERRLAEASRELAESCRSEAEFARRWRRVAERWSFDEVNELIEKHNRNFPAESRLPMDPRTGDFVRLNGKPYRLEPLDAAWILDRFPADLEALRVDVDHDC